MPSYLINRLPRVLALATPLVTSFAATFVTTVTPLAAQSARDTVALPHVVVTATRVGTPVSSHTATVTVLDGAALRAEGVTHLGDALRRVPGLAVARTSSFGSQTALFMRGGQSNYVRLLVDGVPLNEPGGVLDLGRIALDDVERIEIVRGPVSVLYGSDAVTGVIQLFTRRGAGRPVVDAEVGGGSHGARRASLGASGGTEHLSWAVQGDHHASDGVLAFNNAYRNDGMVATLGVSPNAATDLRLTARFSGSRYEFPTESDGTVRDRNAERTEHRLLLGFDAGHRWTPRVETRVQLSSSELLPRSNDGADDAADTLGFYGYFARGTVTRRVADTRTTVRLGATQLLTVGTEFSRDAERSTSRSESEFGDFPDAFRAARENVAVYAQGLGDVRALSYTLGGRVDENSAFGTFRTARAGLAWRVAAGWQVRGSLGTAFKSPSFFENFATGFTVGNPALRPERSRAAELGIESLLGRGLHLRVTGFAQRFRDLIQYTGAPPTPGDPNYYNIAQANAGGVEVEATLPSLHGFVVDAGYTWTDTKVVDAGFDTAPEANFVEGGRLLRRPEHAATLGVTRTFGDLGSVTTRVVRTGAREDRDFATFPAAVVLLRPFTTIDVGLELRAPEGAFARAVRGATLSLRAENLANVRYEQVAGYASPGRVLYAGLRLRR